MHLSREGLILSRHYVHTKCSPSRAALLTGRLAWTMGRQRGAIERYQPAGLSTNYTLLPSYLRKAGYSTHAVGKEGIHFKTTLKIFLQHFTITKITDFDLSGGQLSNLL